ncbi:hypothetical protein [Dethiothermospora halolimnae]|uniref:hypothetical protein n=1 Tax=Dethiothermospora halolimnae TaxID=3114390 RepID=UPI003CCBD7E4
MFNIKSLEDKAIFLVTGEGKISNKEADHFIRNLKDKINNIDTNKYNLVLDIKNIKINSIGGLLKLSKILNIYNSTDFDKLFFVDNGPDNSKFDLNKVKSYINKDIIKIKNIDEIS